MKKYLANIHVMEELTRVQTNLALLKKNQAKNIASGKRTIDVEVMGLRIGDFVMVTFPGELTVQIGLNIKRCRLIRVPSLQGTLMVTFIMRQPRSNLRMWAMRRKTVIAY